MQMVIVIFRFLYILNWSNKRKLIHTRSIHLRTPKLVHIHPIYFGESLA